MNVADLIAFLTKVDTTGNNGSTLTIASRQVGGEVKISSVLVEALLHRNLRKTNDFN